MLYLWASTFHLWNLDLDLCWNFFQKLVAPFQHIGSDPAPTVKFIALVHWLALLINKAYLFTERKTQQQQLLWKTNTSAREGYEAGDTMDFLVIGIQALLPQTLPDIFSTYLHRCLVHRAWSRMRMAKVGTVRNWWWQNHRFSASFCKWHSYAGCLHHSSLNTRNRMRNIKNKENWKQKGAFFHTHPLHLPYPRCIQYRSVTAFKNHSGIKQSSTWTFSYKQCRQSKELKYQVFSILWGFDCYHTPFNNFSSQMVF